MFLTHVLAFQVGEKLDIKNSDPIGHNTKIDPGKGVPFNQNLPTGQSVAYLATAEEAFPGHGVVQHPSLDAGLHAAAQGQVFCRDESRRIVRNPQSAGRRGRRDASLARARRRSRRRAGAGQQGV